MQHGKRGADTRDRLLDTVARIMSTTGVCGLTLDAVAMGAHVSKGGLLYHFPSKEALLQGLLDRHLEHAAQRRAKADGLVGDRLANRLRAALARVDDVRSSPSALPLLGIIALEPKLLTQLRRSAVQAFAEYRKDSKRFALAMVVHLAASGLKFGELLGTVSLSAEERESLLAELKKLIKQIER